MHKSLSNTIAGLEIKLIDGELGKLVGSDALRKAASLGFGERYSSPRHAS